MTIKQFKNILNKDEQNYFKKEVVDNLHFPFYLNKRIRENDITDSFPYFTHKILMTPEEVKAGSERRNSGGYDYCAHLFDAISKRLKFKYKSYF